MIPDRATILHKRIRALTWLFVLGLLISGVTAIPLVTGSEWLARWTGADALAEMQSPPGWAVWIVTVRSALAEINATYPFVFYGTDWLAFGHFTIAIAFAGALRDPVKNEWLYTFGLITCALVIPYALLFGALRGIPLWWRLVDCAFGVLGAIPLWLCRIWVRELAFPAVRPARDS